MNAFETIASTADPAFATDPDGAILAWNNGAANSLGYEESQAVGKRCYQLLRGADVFGNRYCDENCALVRMARRRETVHHFEVDVRHASNDVVRMGVSAFVAPGQKPAEFAIIHLLTLAERRAGSAPFDGRGSPSTKPSAGTLSALVRPTRPEVAAALTPREIEVLRLLAEGNNSAEIARLLFISVVTVRNHIQRILKKLGVHGRLEAVSVARRTGLI